MSSVIKWIEFAEEVRRLADSEPDAGMCYAAEYILRNATKNPAPKYSLDIPAATEIVTKFVDRLLAQDQFEAAATVLWGRTFFDWRPKSTRDTWRCLWAQDKLLIQGAGSMGKTYGMTAWFYMDWLKDPTGTCIKVVSLSREHATRNIFADFQNFQRNALVGPKVVPLSGSIQADDNDAAGIHLVAIPEGKAGYGSLRGFHPKPRAGEPHPEFGKLSRVRAVLDEGEQLPVGVWEGVNNILSTLEIGSDRGRVKIASATNPKDMTSEFGRRCEPKHGWGSITPDDDFEWESMEGWHVLRIDAATSENVVAKKIVFPGLQTYEGFMNYLSVGETAEYWTMCRGWFPSEGISMAIISPSLIDNAIGTLGFTGPVIPMAAFDLALQGNDKVICSYGRAGLCDGWTPRSGHFISFEKPKVCLQLDQQIVFQKQRTLEQAAAIKKFCKTMRISSGWLCVDRTGNGGGIHDALCSTFGKDVMGVDFGWMATDKKVMNDEQFVAHDVYHGIVTELLFSLAKYLEFGYLKIAPSFRHDILAKQACGRKYRQKGQGLVRSESKADYVKRTKLSSPDELDSLTLLVHLCRMRSVADRVMVENPTPQVFPHEQPKFGVDAIEFVDFSQ